MADFNKPDNSGSLWSNILSELRSARESVAKMFDGGAGDTNIPTNAKRIDNSDGQVYNFNGTTWDSLGVIRSYLVDDADDTTTGVLTASGFNTSSDVRLKNNIKPSDEGLTSINKLKSVTYSFKNKPSEIRHGLIAQDVIEVLPHCVFKCENGYLAIDYDQIISVIIKAIQELSEEK